MRRRCGGVGQARRGVWLRGERLEPRVVLDARVVITEVVASNTQGLEDEDDERSDWMELYNAGDAPAQLGGWHLTDDVQDPAKWTFPPLTLNPDNYLLVFASGKDRRDPQSNLHTNFRLDADGDYLGLVEPDGSSVAFEFAPRFPALLPDRSYGISQDSIDTPLVEANAGLRLLIPSTANGGAGFENAWTDPDFDDTAWTTGRGGVGFGDEFEEFIGTDIRSQLAGVNSSVFIRIPFTLQQPDQFFSAALRIRYNDGYVAYLNGQEIARANAPDRPTWNSVATTSRSTDLSKSSEEVDISAWVGLLRQGTNVLAIHGLNRSLTSGDLLFAAELRGERPAALETGTARFFERPSPGRANGLVSYAGLVANTSSSVQRGFFDAPFETRLSAETPGATLVYTTDGSAPTLENGLRVPAPDAATGPSTTVGVARTTTLRVAAFKDDFLPSRVDTQTYIFLDDVIRQDYQSTLDAGFPNDWKGVEPDYGLDPDVIGPNDLFGGRFASQIVDALKAAPTLSLVAETGDLFDVDRGIYVNSVNSGPAWERPVSVEMIYPDGSVGFQENAGIRIQGENVRNLSGSRKQSFRLEFREQYGATKLRFPILGDGATDRFDTLIVRGQFNDRWVAANAQYIRDQWARETLLEMGQPNSHGIFVHVYLNGFYWGMYNLIERPNASFASSYFGGNKDEWDALNSGVVRDGTDVAWKALRTASRAVKSNDRQQSNTAYLGLLGKNAQGVDDPNLETLLDLDNYIDYLIMNFYGGNTDWPHKNYYVARQRGPQSTGFKFFSWDAEKILDHGGGSDLNTDQTGQTAGAADTYASLRGNAEFRLAFADRVQRHFFNGGALYVDPANPAWDPAHPENNQPAARYYEIAAQAELPLIGESARWGDSGSGQPRTLIEWQATRDALYTSYFPQRSAIVLDQFVQAGLYPALAAPVFSQHGGVVQPDFQLSMSAPGDIYFTLDGTDPRQHEWDPALTASGVSPAAVRYDRPVTLPAGAVVKARTMVDGQWSALSEASFQLAPPPLRISEVMYHPRDPQGGEAGDAEDFEFVELVNVSPNNSVDLTGVAFTDGVEFVFSSGTLQPGQRTVVVRSREAFAQRYGDQVSVAGEYGEASNLSNGGESLRLVDRFGQLIQEFTYDDAWIASTDGDGYSLTIVRQDAEPEAWNSAAGWRASAAIDGSPGRDDGADFNGDGQTNSGDLDLYCTGYRAGDLRYDLTRDGIVDQRDLEFLMQGLFGTTFGDANLDGRFNAEDLARFVENGKYEDDVLGNSTWSDGDWNCDGDFDSRDLVLAFSASEYLTAALPARTLAPTALTARLHDLAFAREVEDQKLSRRPLTT